MFDVNPNPYGGDGALDMGDLFADAPYYRFTRAEAEKRYAEIKAVVKHS